MLFLVHLWVEEDLGKKDFLAAQFGCFPEGRVFSQSYCLDIDDYPL